MDFRSDFCLRLIGMQLGNDALASIIIHYLHTRGFSRKFCLLSRTVKPPSKPVIVTLPHLTICVRKRVRPLKFERSICKIRLITVETQKEMSKQKKRMEGRGWNAVHLLSNIQEYKQVQCLKPTLGILGAELPLCRYISTSAIFRRSPPVPRGTALTTSCLSDDQMRIISETNLYTGMHNGRPTAYSSGASSN